MTAPLRSDDRRCGGCGHYAAINRHAGVCGQFDLRVGLTQWALHCRFWTEHGPETPE